MTSFSAVSTGSRMDQSAPRTVESTVRRGAITPCQARCIEGYIACNLQCTIRLADLARVAQLGLDRFRREFKQHFGLTPYQYVIRKRIERAQNLMVISDESLRDISAECGFSDQFHFSNAFCAVVGQRPGAWRRWMSAQIRASATLNV
jgi:AraC family transcriptional regulator